MAATVFLALGVAAAAALAGLLYLVVLYRREQVALRALDQRTPTNPGRDEPGADAPLAAPELSGTIWDLITLWRHRKKARKLARRGYVRWYLFDGNLQKPRWVKPEREGKGVPEYRHDGLPYLFPEDALVLDQSTGAYVAVHHKGEPEPVNLAEPAFPTIDGDRLEELINLSAESDPPTFWSRLDLDFQTAIGALIAIMFVLFAASQFLG